MINRRNEGLIMSEIRTKNKKNIKKFFYTFALLSTKSPCKNRNQWYQAL
ncbi:hypothetical protein BACCOP_03899 [Phocaeicola coprocola DSM 17136]|uniref:Uncharacterized protein n=1 Tax=Phocaeicola coprocola DSM 17136 TaxID=470145 RepID=B3JPD8_9BACT|nr:hypothetical protein BACCOP_03899 [Phocaeicola coprocola DSM 17136]